MVGCYVLLHPGQIFLLVIYNLTNSYRDKRCVLCIFQAVHRICCGNNFDGLMFLHTARFFSKILLWVILTRWMPCFALRLNIIKLIVGSIITFHEPSKVNSQSINTLQFLFQVISECNKDL